MEVTALLIYSMRNLLFGLIAFVTQLLECDAQNLVINSSLEDTIPCAIYTGPPLLRPYNWFLPTSGSSDFFNLSTICGFGGGVPSNVFGFQYPYSLNSYLGFSIYNTPPDGNYREYVSGTLFDTLKSGHKYCVEFYVSAANTCKYLTDDIGAYFCADSSSITDYTTNLVLNLIPQVVNIQGNILNDTLNWMLISGDFIAQGGEKFITIGNFKDAANTTLVMLPGATQNFGYYYIDDVSVWDCTVGIEENNNEEKKIVLFPNPASEKLTFNYALQKNKTSHLEIYSVLSQKVKTEQLNKNEQTHHINVSEFSEGIYYCKLVVDGKLEANGKFIKIK